METVKKICILYNKNIEELDKYVDLSCIRPGQDVRYALDDSKLRMIGWIPLAKFDDELVNIVEYYKNKFIW